MSPDPFAYRLEAPRRACWIALVLAGAVGAGIDLLLAPEHHPAWPPAPPVVAAPPAPSAAAAVLPPIDLPGEPMRAAAPPAVPWFAGFDVPAPPPTVRVSAEPAARGGCTAAGLFAEVFGPAAVLPPACR